VVEVLFFEKAFEDVLTLQAQERAGIMTVWQSPVTAISGDLGNNIRVRAGTSSDVQYGVV
jgi:hypothetical protein